MIDFSYSCPHCEAWQRVEVKNRISVSTCSDCHQWVLINPKYEFAHKYHTFVWLMIMLVEAVDAFDSWWYKRLAPVSEFLQQWLHVGPLTLGTAFILPSIPLGAFLTGIPHLLAIGPFFFWLYPTWAQKLKDGEKEPEGSPTLDDLRFKQWIQAVRGGIGFALPITLPLTSFDLMYKDLAALMPMEILWVCVVSLVLHSVPNVLYWLGLHMADAPFVPPNKRITLKIPQPVRTSN